MGFTLYELTTQYKEVQFLDEEGMEGLEDTLEAIEDALEHKLENIAKLIKSLGYEEEAYKQEIAKLRDKKKAVENKTQRLKDYIKFSLESAGLDKVKGDLFTVSIRNNAPSVNVLDEEAVPSEYHKVIKPELNKTAILKDLKAEKEIAGVEIQRTQSVSIR